MTADDTAAAAFLACCGSTDGSHLLACPTAHATCNHGEGRCVQDAAALRACQRHQREGCPMCLSPVVLGCPSVYPPSATGPYSDERGWSGPLRCVLGHSVDKHLHANSGIFWREGSDGADTGIRDTLIDCMTSFGIHGDAAREAADYILSPSSGLSVTQAEASLPVLPCGCVPPCEGHHEDEA